MQTVNAVKLFLLGVIAALLVTVVLQDGNRVMSSAKAEDHASAGGIIALSGNTGSKYIGLILIDTTTKNMCYYLADDARELRLVSARSYMYDIGCKHLPFNLQGYDVADKKDFPKEINKNITAKKAYELYTQAR